MSNNIDFYNTLTSLIQRGLRLFLRGPDGVLVTGPDASLPEVSALVDEHLDEILESLREAAEVQLPSHIMGLDIDLIRRRAGRDWFELLADQDLLRAFAWAILVNRSGRIPMAARRAQADYNGHLLNCKECLVPVGSHCRQGRELRSRYHLAVMSPHRTIGAAS